MPYKILNKRGDWLVQVQRQGIRRTRRGKGGEAKAKRVEAELMLEVEKLVERRKTVKVLGFDWEVWLRIEAGRACRWRRLRLFNGNATRSLRAINKWAES